MTLTKTLASLFVLPVLMTGPALSKVQHGEVVFLEPADFAGQYRAIAETVYSHNIAIVDGSVHTHLCTSPKKGGNIAGWYNSYKNFMVICDGPQALKNETLAHEAVHVAQDCRGELDTEHLLKANKSYLTAILNNIDPRKSALIASLYPKHVWEIELEAFFYETRPNLVLELLNKECAS